MTKKDKSTYEQAHEQLQQQLPPDLYQVYKKELDVASQPLNRIPLEKSEVMTDEYIQRDLEILEIQPKTNKGE